MEGAKKAYLNVGELKFWLKFQRLYYRIRALFSMA